MVATLIPLAFISASQRLDQALNSLSDKTFDGIHTLQWFDYAILIPYFSVLIVLSFYGLHRYHMIRGYWKYRRNMPREAPTRFEQLPRVTVQLPIFNEQYVVERLLEETIKIDYPRELLEIQ